MTSITLTAILAMTLMPNAYAGQDFPPICETVDETELPACGGLGEFPPGCNVNSFNQELGVTSKITVEGDEIADNPASIGINDSAANCAAYMITTDIEWGQDGPGPIENSATCTDIFVLPGDDFDCTDAANYTSDLADADGNNWTHQMKSDRVVFMPNGVVFDFETNTANTVLIANSIALLKTVNVDKVLVGDTVNYDYDFENTGDGVLSCILDDDIEGELFNDTIFPNTGNIHIDVDNVVITEDTTNIATLTCLDQEQTELEAEAEVTVEAINPSILVEKTCEPAIQAAPGTIEWWITVTNTGDSTLTNVSVLDPTLGIDISGETLIAGATLEFHESESGLESGVYVNTSSASGVDQLENEYTSEATATCEIEEGGSEGLTPGFWKANAENWEAGAWVAEDPEDDFNARFGTNVELKLQKQGTETSKGTSANPTLFGAMSVTGGGENRLAFHCVAAKLNAEHPDVNYPMSLDQVIIQCRDALNSGDNEIMNTLKDILDVNNNLGADISQHWPDP